MNARVDPTTSQEREEAPAGRAPADARVHAPWPRWRIALAYGVLFAVALASVWFIDDHVLKATPPPTTRPHSL
jgi:hypothetical protein